MTSLFLGQAVFGKTIILINSNNGLQVPEPKAGRLSWEHCGGSSVYFNESFLTAGAISRTMLTKNIGQDKLGDLRSILQASHYLMHLNYDS